MTYSPPYIAVIMATYNGAAYIEEQLLSIINGNLVPDLIVIGDDGSSDKTLQIAKDVAKQSDIAFSFKFNQQRLGPAENFLNLLNELPDQVTYAALADQDDVWEPDKLERAIDRLAFQDQDQPALYCSRQKLIDEEGRFIKLSPLFTRPPSFTNALVENIATGCTVVINRAALNAVQKAGISEVSFHDWWLYLLVSGLGGEIVFDPRPTISYRQHNQNFTGSPVSSLSRIYNVAKRQFSGTTQAAITKNIAVLGPIKSALTSDNQDTLDAFVVARNGPLPARLGYLKIFAPYRQSRLDDFFLRALFVANRL